MALIEFKDVFFKYNNERNFAVENLNFTINQGENIAIIGHNGSGKSTTAKLLNGLCLPASGSVIIDGLNTLQKDKLFDVRKTVGVVFQNPDNQTVASIVEDDVAFGPENLGVKREEIGERIDYALKAVDMEEYRKATVSRLSGGQKQRIAIAGVLAIKPKVLVLDESTAMLDPKGRKEIMTTAEKLNKEEGMTVINITHYMDETVNADRIIVMSDGKIVAVGTPAEIFKRGEQLKSIGLDIPLARKIADNLAKNGINVSKNVLDYNDLSEELCKLLRKA